MKRLRWTALLFALAALLPLALPPAPADAEKAGEKEDGFVPMFNGKNLSGWVNANCAPSTFYVKDGMVITTGKPTGFLRTEKQYENFIADFEWMHVPPAPGAVGNSGFFVWADPIPAVGTGYTRGIEVQVLVNLTYKNKKGEITATSQGDLFSIWGATCVPDRPHPDGWARCLPSEDRCKGANEWNHYRVEAVDGVIKLAVNGKVVSGVSKCSPRKGYLALESEGSECRFRNLKIKELPSTNPTPEETANVAQGHRQLYTGLDLSGWQANDEAKKHWLPRDWMLHYDGQGKALRTEKEFGDAEFIVDFKFPKEGAKRTGFVLRRTDTGDVSVGFNPDGTFDVQGSVEKGSAWKTPDAQAKGLKPAGQWNRLSVTAQGRKLTIALNGQVVKEMDAPELPAKGTFALTPTGEMDFGNLFVRELSK
jgi:hypothetical protein